MAAGLRGSGRPAVLVRLLAVVALAELAAGVAVAAAPGHRPGAPPAATAPRPPSSTTTAAARPAPAVPSARVRGAEELLAARATAVRHRDRPAFLATVDPAQPALRRAQARVLDNLAGVPLASWSYSVDPLPAAPLPPARRRALGGSAWLAEVTLRYALRGFDARPTADRLYLTFVARGGRWYLAGQDDGAAAGLRGARELWDSGPVVAVRGARSLVLGHPSSGGDLAAIAAEADRDVPHVTAFWGRRGWADRVVVLVPADYRELEGLVGGQDLSRIAAVATAEVDGSAPGGGGTTGDRIIVNPATFGDLGALGRRVVLTHEITHVAARSATGPVLPDWLVEGIADYVGFRGSGITTAVAARELAVQVAAHGLPRRLPSDGAFDGGRPDLPVAYEQAWLACRYVADRWGEATLRALYRAVGTSDEPRQADAVREGLARVLHTTPEAFTAGWRAYVRAELP